MKPTRFVKKPIVIEAVHLDETADPEDIARWCNGRVFNNFGHPSGKRAIVIPTLGGHVTAQYGDWIIRGVKGEFYPIKDSIFRETYDPVGEGDQ